MKKIIVASAMLLMASIPVMAMEENIIIRSGPSTYYEEVGTIDKNAIIQTQDIYKNWRGETWKKTEKGWFFEREEKKLKGKIVVLDPGHGNKRSGAVRNGIVEKNLNLDIAMKVKVKLENEGATVYLTRSGDTDCERGVSKEKDLSCRPNLAKTKNANLFLSIHANSGNDSAEGAETYYYKKSDKLLAEHIQKSYIEETKLASRKIKYGDYRVLREGKVPGALIELGFLTNREEAQKMKGENFKEQMADGLYKGIINYLDSL